MSTPSRTRSAQQRPAAREAQLSRREAMRTATIEPYLETLWQRGGTDLHLTVGAPPLLRIDGELHPVNGEPVMTASAIEDIAVEVLGEAAAARYPSDGEIDFSLTWHDRARLRGNIFRQRQVPAIALRMIPSDIPSFQELGLPPIMNEFVTLPQGLVLVTGPTGSGKSTTLASMLEWINTNRACHIITIEDPIEYVHSHKRSAVNQREVGDDSPSFESALRAALREDPDVLLIGEMRDLESIATALTVAETGHLVFATLHTNDTAQALDRIVDVFPAERRTQIQVQLASVLSGVIYQRLLPRVGSGLVAAFEIMVGTYAVRNLIREGKTRQLRNIITTSQADGMQTFESDLNRLIADGTIEVETALGVSLYPREVTARPPVPQPAAVAVP